MKNFYVAANWKMNKTIEEAQSFIAEFKTNFKPIEKRVPLFLPSFLHLASFQKEFTTKGEIIYGAQNCYCENSGAFTGEVSPTMLKELGATCALVGHSERRHIFLESDELIAKKMVALKSQELIPILCIGETEAERAAGQTLPRIQAQLLAALADNVDVIIAYEPVWAIGTGKVPSMADINQVHNFIREILLKKWGQKGTDIPILYGGSVNASNSAEIETIDNVNGFLIGGASLKVSSYLDIYNGV